MDFRLPELGEGIADATVVNVAVKPGQAVNAGDTLIEVETDKAAMPIQATAAGTVTEIKVKPGDKVKVGAVIAVMGGAQSSPPSQTAKPTAAAGSPPPLPGGGRGGANPPTAPAGDFQQKLPNLGEGIEAGTVVSLNVKAGDAVTKGQEILTVETDKASMPVPSEVDGTVKELKVKPGDKVAIGQLLAVIAATSGGAAQSAATAGKPAAKETPAQAKPQVSSAPAENGTPGVLTTTGLVPAGPATRQYAREHAVSLGEVPGTARGGRVTVDDVKTHIRKRMQGGGSTGGVSAPPMPDFSKFGPVEKKPLSNLRKKIAENLTVAATVIPAVTQFDLADITDLEAGRKRITENLPKGSPKVTMTVLAIKAVVAALKEYPTFNGAFDLANNEIVLKGYYHVGIAVDTERGLVVPVIRDADKKSIRDLANEVASLAEKARGGKLTIDEMRGGSFTITNLGGIGGTAFTPIINYPEVAILGLSRSAIQPAYRDGQFVPRLMMPLSLTYDHRIIDGADGARFTTRLVQLFSDPIRLLMES